MRTFPCVAVFLIQSSLVATAQIAQREKLPPEVPPNYRQQIVEEMKTAYTFQTRIRSAQISSPNVTWGGVIKPLGKIATICVKYVAKEPPGYDRQSKAMYLFSDGKLAQSVIIKDNGQELSFQNFCGSLVYTPFPEFDGLRPELPSLQKYETRTLD